jgi:hypothetical protein
VRAVGGGPEIIPDPVTEPCLLRSAGSRPEPAGLLSFCKAVTSLAWARSLPVAVHILKAV